MPDLSSANVGPDQLLLDPNNFRFQDSTDFLRVAEDRFHEEGVQDRAYQRIRSEEKLLDLKRSIQRNGYIPVERIVVRPYEHLADRFVVIEGNRRVAAAKWILEDHAAGAAVDEDVLSTLAALPVLVAEEEAPDEAFRASLMGIRHVSGIKQWGGYQRARLIVEMRDNLELDPQDVAERLALSTHEVNRRFRAYKALQQLQEDEEFGDYAESSMYPLFHEAVSLPIVREWLEWNEEAARFEHEENLRTFYTLITPTVDDDENQVEPKLKGYSDVRELRTILAKPDAKRILLDPHRTLQEAVAAAHQDELAKSWAGEVGAAVAALENMGIDQVRRLDEEGRSLLESLAELVQRRLKDHELLKGAAVEGAE